MERTALAAIILANLVLSAAFAGADETVREVSVYGGLVSLEVPESWREIPPEVLEFYSLRSAEASGGRTAEIYQHGFRLGEPEADFAPPQILIQIRESGRIPYGSLLHLPPADVLRARVAARHRTGRDPSEADVDVLERQIGWQERPAADEEADCVHVDTQAEWAALEQRLRTLAEALTSGGRWCEVAPAEAIGRLGRLR